MCDSCDCSLPGFSVHGILPARILEWVTFSTPRDLPHPAIEPVSSVSPALQEDYLPFELQRSPLSQEMSHISLENIVIKMRKKE